MALAAAAVALAEALAVAVVILVVATGRCVEKRVKIGKRDKERD